MKALNRGSIENKMFYFFPNGVTLIDFKCLECFDFF